MTAEGMPEQEKTIIPDSLGCLVWASIVGTSLLAVAVALGLVVRAFRWAAGV